MAAKFFKSTNWGMKLTFVSFLGFIISVVLIQSGIGSLIFTAIFFVGGAFGIVANSFSRMKYIEEKEKLEQKWTSEPIVIKIDQPDFKKELLKNIVDGQSEKSIKTLIGFIEDESSAIFQELIQLEIRAIRLEDEVINGLMSKEQENLERNKISDQLIHLINHIKFIYVESVEGKMW